MFGYIKTYKPELKIREFDAYKAVYCSLCKQLRKEYGLFAGFILNYDYTFLAMIRMSAHNAHLSVKKARCPFNPLIRCNNVTCKDDSLSYSAAVAVIMLYYKLKDTCKDEGYWRSVGSKLLLCFVSSWRNKAKSKFPRAEQNINEFCHKQDELERSDTQGLDAFCHPTALALANLFSYEIEDESLRSALYTTGYNVGKWVYLIDAMDDFTQDCKKNRFNPYIRRLGKTVTVDEMVTFAVGQLNICMDEACRAFDRLALKNFQPILKNILFIGLEQVQNDVIRKVKNNV